MEKCTLPSEGCLADRHDWREEIKLFFDCIKVGYEPLFLQSNIGENLKLESCLNYVLRTHLGEDKDCNFPWAAWGKGLGKDASEVNKGGSKYLNLATTCKHLASFQAPYHHVRTLSPSLGQRDLHLGKLT